MVHRMKVLKVLMKDTICEGCNRAENRRRAEAQDWTEITYVDHTGMAVSKAFRCEGCSENWTPDVFGSDAVIADPVVLGVAVMADPILLDPIANRAVVQ